MTAPAIPWWQQPVRMLRVDFTPHFSSVLNEDLEQLARSHKDQWQINCEWIVGSLSVDGKAYQTTFAAEGYERCPGFENFDFLRTYTPIAHKQGIRTGNRFRATADLTAGSIRSIEAGPPCASTARGGSGPLG